MYLWWRAKGGEGESQCLYGIYRLLIFYIVFSGICTIDGTHL